MSATNKSDSSSNRPVIRGSDGDLVSLTQLGRYQIQRKLGSGGMGAVYLALDKNLNRLVALKILPPDKAENPILLKRFEAEAQAAAQLTHDNIVRVYESGEAEGLHYIAMEYVEGTDVQRLIKKRNRIPIRRSTEIIKQVALALDHAASASIVHRDIKPSNLLITQAGVVKLTDLGLARVIDDSEETSITRAGTTVGTVDYMSPEQARSSKAADIRSDLYSLGCTWYHMVTGSPPYPEGSVTNKLHAHATAPIPDPRNLNDTVPEAVVSVIHRLMEKKPIDRYQSVEELLVDLDAVKSTKREVKAEDLAALATAEDEIDEDAEDISEAPARSTVARRRVEAEEDQDEIPARRSRKSQSTEEPEESNRPRKSRPQKPQSSGSSSPIDALPPREKRKLEDVEGKEASSFNIEILKYILLGVALLAFVGIVGYAISYFASEDSKVGNQQIDLAQRAEEIQAEREANSSQDPNAVQSPNTVHQPPNPSPNNTVKAASGSKIDVDQDLNDAVLNQLPVVKIVSRNVKVDEKSAHTPVEALEKNDAAELIIEFDLDRPFVWEQPISIEGRNLFLRSAPEKPARILVNTAGAMVDGLIKGKNAQIVVNGLHFGILAYDVPGKNDLSLFRMIDSDLRVENSTFTIEETRDHP
ncbi:MAG: serine/threonine protein kinase, partial [Planctomycetaceae bacterium]|nr:serine/threonine protein kinase [Planctomycetaceae bacterium]